MGAIERSLVGWIAASLAVALFAVATMEGEDRLRVSSDPGPDVLSTIPDVTIPTLPPIPVTPIPEVTIPRLEVPPVTLPPVPPLPSPVQEVVEQLACVGAGGSVPVTHKGLWLIDADRGCARVVMSGTDVGTPTFSPDGRYAVIVLATSPDPFAPRVLWKLDLVTGLRKAITPPGPSISSAKWSPDGEWIVYDSGPTEPRLVDPTAPDGPHAVDELWLVRPDGSDRHRLMATDGWGVSSWSPDGERLAVVMANHEHIAIVDVDTGEVGYHPTPKAYLASWSPNGSQLVFDGMDDENLYLMDPSTGGYRKLASAAQFPRWSPDGSVIGVLRDDDLVLLRPDGSVVRSDLGTGMPINWSSDGRYLLSAVGNQDYVLDMQTGQYREVAGPGDGPGPWPQSSRWIPGTHQFAAIATTARHYTP